MATSDEDRPADASNGDRSCDQPTASLGSTAFHVNAPGVVDQGESVLPGDLAGSYRLERQIGRGGMGVVWLATHEVHGLQVAVKILYRDAYAQSEEGIAQEFRQVAKLRHINIIKVIDAGEVADRRGGVLPYIAMELLSGARPLDEYAYSRPLELRAALDLFLQACDAVAHVHDSGDMHSDIKPDNILVDADGGRVVVTDFGLARPIRGWLSERVGGTIGFMGPEHLARDHERIDKRSDVWSLGAVLYWLLTSSDPHGLPPSVSRDQRLEAIKQPPRRLVAASPWLGTEAAELIRPLEDIVQTAMAPDPGDRFRDAGALGDELRRALDASGARRMWANARRSRWWGPAALVALVILATPLAFTLSNLVMTRSGSSRRALANWMPAPEDSVAAVPVLPDVVMIPFSTRTAQTLAQSQEVPGFAPGAARGSYRPMHAAVIERLTDLGVRVIVVDVFFSTTNEQHDDLLAGAIKAAHQKGSVVVLGVRSWELSEGKPVLSDTIYDAGPHWGGTTVSETSDVHTADLLIEQDGVDPIPSIALAAFSAHRLGSGFFDYRLGPDGVEIRPYELVPGNPPTRIFSESIIVKPDGRQRVPLPNLEAGLSGDETSSFSILVLPDETVHDRSSLPYEDLWALSEETLRRRLSGKIAFVWDQEKDASVVDETGRRTDVRAARVHAAALQSLLLAYRTPLARLGNIPLSILGAAFGAIITWWLLVHRREDGSKSKRLVRSALTVVLALVVSSVVLVGIAAWVRLETSSWMYVVPGILASLIVAAVIASLPACFRPLPPSTLRRRDSPAQPL